MNANCSVAIRTTPQRANPRIRHDAVALMLKKENAILIDPIVKLIQRNEFTKNGSPAILHPQLIELIKKKKLRN